MRFLFLYFVYVLSTFVYKKMCPGTNDKLCTINCFVFLMFFCCVLRDRMQWQYVGVYVQVIDVLVGQFVNASFILGRCGIDPHTLFILGADLSFSTQTF